MAHRAGAVDGLTREPVGTEAAARVADVLLLLAHRPAPLGVSVIASELGLSKAVVHRILQSLVSRSLVRADPATRAYQLGSGAIALGTRALRDLDLRWVARPVLAALRDQTRETATLSALVGDSRLYLDQYESLQEIKMTVTLGQPYPLYAGASSRVMLAYLPDEVIERILSGHLVPLSESTVLDPEELLCRLDTVRRHGWAISHGERQHGAGSVAAPVFGIDTGVLGAISVCGPTIRFDDANVKRFGPLVRAAAAEISRALGWNGMTP